MNLWCFLMSGVEWSGVAIDVEWISVNGCMTTGDFMHVDDR